MAVQQLQFHPGGQDAAGELPLLPSPLRIPQCHLLYAGLQFYGCRPPIDEKIGVDSDGIATHGSGSVGQRKVLGLLPSGISGRLLDRHYTDQVRPCMADENVTSGSATP